MRYGEILFLGPCNLKCFYCLSNEMHKLQKDNNNQLHTPFSMWNEFYAFLHLLKQKNINTVYLSSVTTDPLLYQYFDELVTYLQEHRFKVGIRTNGYLAEKHINTLLKLDEEISFSVNAIENNINEQICGVYDIPNYISILETFRKHKKSCRISIVVNEYNVSSVFQMLDFFNEYADVITYIQLRKVYKYEEDDTQDCYFKEIVSKIQTSCKKENSFYESKQYHYKKLIVSLWGDVFKKESISSINYFTNGLISSNNLLVPAYEKGETK